MRDKCPNIRQGVKMCQGLYSVLDALEPFPHKLLTLLSQGRIVISRRGLAECRIPDSRKLLSYLPADLPAACLEVACSSRKHAAARDSNVRRVP